LVIFRDNKQEAGVPLESGNAGGYPHRFDNTNAGAQIGGLGIRIPTDTAIHSRLYRPWRRALAATADSPLL